MKEIMTKYSHYMPGIERDWYACNDQMQAAIYQLQGICEDYGLPQPAVEIRIGDEELTGEEMPKCVKTMIARQKRELLLDQSAKEILNHDFTYMEISGNTLYGHYPNDTVPPRRYSNVSLTSIFNRLPPELYAHVSQNVIVGRKHVKECKMDGGEKVIVLYNGIQLEWGKSFTPWDIRFGQPIPKKTSDNK